MKTKVLGSVFLLVSALFFSLPAASPAKEKSYIVVFHERPDRAEDELIRRESGSVQRKFRFFKALHVHADDASIEKIRQDRRVKYVEEDRVVTLIEPAASTLSSPEATNSWGVQHIGADIANAGGNTGKGIKVAVLDTGIDCTHPDLLANCRVGYNFVDPSNPLNTADDSYNGHGTHVAGIIGAAQNGSGVIGVAPDAELYAVKVMDGGGFGTLSWTIAGIDWAVANGIDVVNLSIDAGGDSQALHDACDQAFGAGVLLIAAAGNKNGGAVSYPAAYSSVIAVSATTSSDALAFFSSTGPEVEVAAPGVNIYSTVPYNLPSLPGVGYQTMSGTSMAAPHVAGTAALFLGANLQDVNGDGVINFLDVKRMLESTATDLGAVGKDASFGFGLVNAAEGSLQPAPGTISGTVTTPSGAPLSSATVAVDTGGYTTARVDGRYLLRVLPGTYAITASSGGFASAGATVTVASGETASRDFALTAKPGTIAGTVTDAAGAVVSGATVTTGTGGYTATTAADGTYALTVVAGTYTVTASQSLFYDSSATVTVAPGATVVRNFTLTPKTGRIAGTVTDAGGAVVSGATVATGTGGYTTTTAADGTYSLTVVAGTYTVTASKGGYGSSSVKVPVAAGQTVTANVNLPVTITIARSRGSCDGDAKTVRLPAGPAYDVLIENHGLDEVEVSVYAGGTYQRKLSASYCFDRRSPQAVTFSLPASTAAYKVVFKPSGKIGASAVITTARR